MNERAQQFFASQCPEPTRWSFIGGVRSIIPNGFADLSSKSFEKNWLPRTHCIGRMDNDRICFHRSF